MYHQQLLTIIKQILYLISKENNTLFARLRIWWLGLQQDLPK